MPEGRGRWRPFRRHHTDDEPDTRIVRDGGTYTFEDKLRGRITRERGDPDRPGGRLQEMLGGQGETWDTDKIPREEWVDTGRPDTWPDRSRAGGQDE